MNGLVGDLWGNGLGIVGWVPSVSWLVNELVSWMDSELWSNGLEVVGWVSSVS